MRLKPHVILVSDEPILPTAPPSPSAQENLEWKDYGGRFLESMELELHGFKQIRKARTRCKKIAWSVLFISGLTVSMFTTRIVVKGYLDYSTVTLISIKQKKRLGLPSIFVCPKYPDSLKLSLIKQDMASYLRSYPDEKTARNLIIYSIAGAGFDNLQPFLKRFNTENFDRLHRILTQWVGNRTRSEFYQTLFEDYGYECEDLFEDCHYGSQQLSCCELFKQTNVMLRGRCFRLTRFDQVDPNHYGRMRLTMRQMPSLFMAKTGLQPQIVIYFSTTEEPSSFPRFYVNYRASNRLVFHQRQIKMLSDHDQCSNDGPRRDASKCHVNIWLRKRLLEKHTCTLFYQVHNAPGYEVCDASTVIANYQDVVNTSVPERCLPACDRVQHSVTLRSFAPRSNLDDGLAAFRFEMFYSLLEYEQYEEIPTMTIRGFVAELGDQSNLFIGLSIITVVQLLSSVVLYLYRKSLTRT